MLRQHSTASTPSTATAVVTVDPVGDAHRNLSPLAAAVLAGAAYVVSIYRDNRLVDIDPVGVGRDVDALPVLRARAEARASHWGAAYWAPCGYCGINCSPAVRFDHDRLARTSETAWRVAA
jgi:hypothetical protein